MRFLACAAPKLRRLHCGLQGSPLIAGRPQWQGHTPGSRITGVCARPQRTPFVVRREHSGCPFRCTRFGHRHAVEGAGWWHRTRTRTQSRTRWAGLLQLQSRSRSWLIGDRPLTTASRRGPLAGLQRARSGSTRRAFVACSSAGRASAIIIRRGSRPAAVSALASSNAPQPRRVKGGIADIWSKDKASSSRVEHPAFPKSLLACSL
jgi:hypothetical protein